MTYPLVGLVLVDVVDVDEHDLEASDISETIHETMNNKTCAIHDNLRTRCHASTGCLRRRR